MTPEIFRLMRRMDESFQPQTETKAADNPASPGKSRSGGGALGAETMLEDALRDELPPHMQKIVANRHGEKYLDMDVPTPGKYAALRLPDMKVRVTDQAILDGIQSKLQDLFLDNIVRNISGSGLFSLSDTFTGALSQSIGFDVRKARADKDISLIKRLYSKDFRMIDSKSTEASKPVFSNNRTSLQKFTDNFNRVFPDHAVNYQVNGDTAYKGLEQAVTNYDQNLDDLNREPLYFMLTGKPQDKLNISVSKFFSSCQNLYTGEYKDHLLANVFDPNTKPAYLVFDTPFTDQMGNTVPFTAVARMLVRHIDSEDQLFFDTVYPPVLTKEMERAARVYGKLNPTYEGQEYEYEHVKGLRHPYMDNLKGVPTQGGKPMDLRAMALSDYLSDYVNSETDAEPKPAGPYHTYDAGGERYTVLTQAEATDRVLRPLMTKYITQVQDRTDLTPEQKKTATQEAMRKAKEEVNTKEALRKFPSIGEFLSHDGEHYIHRLRI